MQYSVVEKNANVFHTSVASCHRLRIAHETCLRFDGECLKRLSKLGKSSPSKVYRLWFHTSSVDEWQLT